MKHASKAGGKPFAAQSCSHYGQKEVRVGPFSLRAGGTSHFQAGDFDADGIDLLVPLTDRGGLAPYAFGRRYQILSGVLVDFGGVPEGWKEFLDEVIVELQAGRKILAYCVGSHGRTGCFIGSLIALLESTEETPDPIEAVRTRHCSHAVETRAQAEAIFALRGETLPAKYDSEFTRHETARKAAQHQNS